jgi:8-oxo-dGTP pyrophosphatase MutT (NUDIX family)
MMTVRQAGGVVLYGDQVVLRRSARGEYLFPKGHVEAGETLVQTALREVSEEVGVEAEIVAELGEISFPYQGDEVQVNFYLMQATNLLPDWKDHLRTDTILVPRQDVPGLLSFENYRRLWSIADHLLQKGQAPS